MDKTIQTQADIIFSARQAQNMTMRDFAAALGVSHNAVALWERGETEVSFERMVEWAGSQVEWIRQLGAQLNAVRSRRVLDAIAQTDEALRRGKRARNGR